MSTQAEYQFEDPAGDEREHVTVALGEQSWRARVVLKDFYGVEFDDVLPGLLAELREQVRDLLVDGISAQLDADGHEDSDVSPPVGRLDIEVVELVFERVDERFEVSGRFDADGSAEAAVHSGNDSGTDYLQYDDAATGTFTASLSPDQAFPADLEVNDVEALRSDD